MPIFHIVQNTDAVKQHMHKIPIGAPLPTNSIPDYIYTRRSRPRRAASALTTETILYIEYIEHLAHIEHNYI